MIFLLDEQVVVRFVDYGDVELLSTDKIWLGEREVVGCLEDLDYSTMIQTGCQCGEQVGKEVWLGDQL